MRWVRRAIYVLSAVVNLGLALVYRAGAAAVLRDVRGYPRETVLFLVMITAGVVSLTLIWSGHQVWTGLLAGLGGILLFWSGPAALSIGKFLLIGGLFAELASVSGQARLDRASAVYLASATIIGLFVGALVSLLNG
jgi:hypothetical protein